MKTNRRHFIHSTGIIGASAFILGTEGRTEEESAPPLDTLFDSWCVLQNPTEHSISVTWTVNAPATGWVEWGKSSEKLDQKADGACFGLRPYDDHVITIPIGGLEPNTTYYYRAACAKVDFLHAYDVKTHEPEFSPVYSFTTPGKNTSGGSFAVMNDTHQHLETLQRATAKLRDLQADYTLWNGDLLNDIYDAKQVSRFIMKPADAPFAVEKPLLLVRGNHDHRGPWARNLPRYLTPWKHENTPYSDLGYNYVVRHGDLALIGLDTGEDKPDFRQEWAGLASFEPYIARQGEWLAEVMETDTVQSAPFIVVFCHIPLFDARPNANPGTLETGYSFWKKLAADFWGPTLQKQGVQLVVAAHVHAHRVDPPAENRCWTQITGGGPGAQQHATLIHGSVQNGLLKIDVHDLFQKEIVTSLEIPPRKNLSAS